MGKKRMILMVFLSSALSLVSAGTMMWLLHEVNLLQQKPTIVSIDITGLARERAALMATQAISDGEDVNIDDIAAYIDRAAGVLQELAEEHNLIIIDARALPAGNDVVDITPLVKKRMASQ